eukprot:jgi/Astpho2/4541/fgenesh1_pg.00067_%23_97_t
MAPPSAWGMPGAQESNDAPAVHIGPGQEMCTLCMNAAVSIYLQPCKHQTCSNCVNSLRRSAVGQASSGVRCPWCRALVGGYEPMDPSHANDELREANRSARLSALRDIAPMQRQDPALRAHAPPDHRGADDWTCPRCRFDNKPNRATCRECKAKKPDAVRKDQNYMAATAEDVYTWCTQKLHPALDGAFQAAGVPITTYRDDRIVTGKPAAYRSCTLIYCRHRCQNINNLQTMAHITNSDPTCYLCLPAAYQYGSRNAEECTREQAINALQRKSYQKLTRVVDILIESGKVPELVTHYFGNYSIQDLMEACFKLRKSFEKQGRKADDAVQYFLNPDTDPFGRMFQEVLKTVPESIKHTAGAFVMQKLLQWLTPQEVVTLGKVSVTHVMDLANDTKGLHFMLKLSQISLTNSEQDYVKDAAQQLHAICHQYLSSITGSALPSWATSFAGQMLVEAIAGSMPLPSSCTLANNIAGWSSKLLQLPLKDKSTPWLMLEQLYDIKQLPGSKPSKEAVEMMLCTAADSFDGNFHDVLCVGGGPKDHPNKGQGTCKAMQKLILRLDEQEEKEWVQHIMEDLTSSMQKLFKVTHARDVVLEGLTCVHSIDDDSLNTYFEVITRQLGKGDMRWQSIMVKIRAARDAKRGIKANGAAVSEARPSPRSGDGKEVTAAPARAEPLEAHSLPAAQQQQPELPLRMADGLPAVVQHPPQQQQPQQQRPLGPAAGLLAGLPAPVQQQSCTATADVIKAMRSQGGLKEVSQQELQRLPSHVSKEQQAALLAGQIKVSDLAQSRPSVPPGFPGAYAPPASSGPPRTAAMGALQQQASPQQPLPQSGGLTAQGNGGLQFGSMGMPAVNQAQGQLWRGPQGPGAHYGGSAAPRLGYGSAMPPGGVDPGQGSAQRMGPAGLPPPVGPPAQQSHISAAPQTVSGPNAAPGGPVTGGGHYGSQGGGAFPGQVSPRGLRPPMGPARPEAGQGQQPPSAAAGMGRPGGQPTPSLQAPFGLAGLNLPPAEPRRAVPPSLPSHLDNMLPAQTSADGLSSEAPRSSAPQQEWKQAPLGLELGHKAMQQPMPQQAKWDGRPQDGSPGLPAGAQGRPGPVTGADGYAPGTGGPGGYGAGLGGRRGLPQQQQQQQRLPQREAPGSGAPPLQGPGPTPVQLQEQALAEAKQQQQQRSAAAAAALQNFSKRSVAPAAAPPQQPQVPAHKQPPPGQRPPQISQAQQAAWMREHTTVQMDDDGWETIPAHLLNEAEPAPTRGGHRQQQQQQPRLQAQPPRGPRAAQRPSQQSYAGASQAKPSRGRNPLRDGAPAAHPGGRRHLPSPPPSPDEPWTCHFCSACHEGPQSTFLACKTCGLAKGSLGFS